MNNKLINEIFKRVKIYKFSILDINDKYIIVKDKYPIYYINTEITKDEYYLIPNFNIHRVNNVGYKVIYRINAGQKEIWVYNENNNEFLYSSTHNIDINLVNGYKNFNILQKYFDNEQ
jgi:hypothetical protein